MTKNDLKKKYEPYLNKGFNIPVINKDTGKMESEELRLFELLTIKIDEGKPDYFATGINLLSKEEIRISLDNLDNYGELTPPEPNLHHIVLSNKKLFTSFKLEKGSDIKLNSIAVVMNNLSRWPEVVDNVTLKRRARNFRTTSSNIPHDWRNIQIDKSPIQPVWNKNEILFHNNRELYTTLDLEIFINPSFKEDFELVLSVDYIPRNQL